MAIGLSIGKEHVSETAVEEVPMAEWLPGEGGDVDTGADADADDVIKERIDVGATTLSVAAAAGFIPPI
jgi:hypothetical protein